LKETSTFANRRNFNSSQQTMLKKQKFPHLLGSKWTALESTFGWRHFQVVNRKNQGEWVYAELVSSCDAEVRFWINAQILKDQRRWKAGWRTLEELGLAKADPVEPVEEPALGATSHDPH
jgi:tryptophan-rich hypothetical protein